MTPPLPQFVQVLEAVIRVRNYLNIRIKTSSDGKDSLADGDEAGAVAVVLGAAERRPRVRLHVVHSSLAPVAQMITKCFSCLADALVVDQW